MTVGQLNGRSDSGEADSERSRQAPRAQWRSGAAVDEAGYDARPKSGVYEAEMNLRSLVPVLDVRDVELSIEFYCDVLGFEVHDKVKWGGRTEWALLKTDHVQLMLCASEDAGLEERESSPEGVFFLHHENLESLMVYLGSRGYTEMPEVLKPEHGGRDFFIRDPDGYVLWFSHKPMGSLMQTGSSSDATTSVTNTTSSNNPSRNGADV